jgi:hypothetical protein
MFSFKQFSGNARFARLRLVGSNGAVFTPFNNCNFNAPPTLYIPIPAFLDFYPYQKPVKLALSVSNPSPLHLNMGSAYIRILDSSGSQIVHINSTTDIVALNNNEGGDSTHPPHLAYFEVMFDLFNVAWDLPGLVIKMLRGKPLDFLFKVHIQRNGIDIDWIKFVTEYLLNHGIKEKLFPLLGTILANVKVSVAPRIGHEWFNMNGSVISDIRRKLSLRQHFPEIDALLNSQPERKDLVTTTH